MKKLTILAAVLVMALAFTAGPVLAEYPDKPVKLIVPWKAGGGTDALFRVVAHYAAKYLGESVVIVNAPGVGGALPRVEP